MVRNVLQRRWQWPRRQVQYFDFHYADMILTLFLLVFPQDTYFLKQSSCHVSHVLIGQILPFSQFHGTSFPK